MKDERYWPVLGTWLKDTATAPPDPRQTARRVVERLPQTTQLRRHWWLRSPRFAPSRPSGRDPTTYQPSPIPATNGHTPTVIGRTQIMFSPAKALIAGALVFGIGGALLVAEPFQQQGSVPGAEADSVAPTWVTGSMQQVEDSCSELGSSSDGGVSRHSYECTFTWTSSDPRLTGDASRPWNEDSYQTDEGPISVSVVANYLKNDGGDWTCSTVSLLKGSSPTGESLTDGDTYLCIGGGGYEGLSAVLVSKYMADSFGDDFSGLDLLWRPPAAPGGTGCRVGLPAPDGIRDTGSLGHQAEGPALPSPIGDGPSPLGADVSTPWSGLTAAADSAPSANCSSSRGRPADEVAPRHRGRAARGGRPQGRRVAPGAPVDANPDSSSHGG